MKKRRIILLSVLGGTFLVCFSLLVLIQTGWVHERLRAFAAGKLEETTGWHFEIERFGGNLLTGVTVEGVSITQPGREEAIAEIEEIEVRYNILDLTLGSKDIESILVTGPFVDVGADWQIRKEEDSPSKDSAIPDFSIGSLRIEAGRVVGVPQVEQVDSIDLDLTVSAEEGTVSFTLSRCAMEVKDLQIRKIASQGSFEKELLTLQGFELIAEGARVNLRGVMGAEHIDLSGEMDFVLGEFSHLLAEPTVSGTVHSSFEVLGTKDSTSAEGTVRVDRLVVDEYVLGDLNGEFVTDLDKAKIDIKSWAVANGEVKGSVELDLKSTKVAAGLTAARIDISRVSAQLADYNSVLNFRVDAILTGVAPTMSGQVKLTMDGSRVKDFSVEQLRTRLTLSGDVLQIQELELNSKGASASASGKVYPEAVDLSLQVNAVELSQFSDLLGAEPLSGRLFADLLVQGDPREPTVVGSFWVSELVLPRTEIEYIDGYFSARASSQDPRLDLQLSIPTGILFDRKLSRFSLNVEGEDQVFSYSTDFDIDPASVELSGEVRISPTETWVVNRNLLIESNGHVVTTDGNLVLLLIPEVRLDSSKFSIGDGWLTLAGSYHEPDSLEGTIIGENISLEVLSELGGLQQILRGYLGLDLELSGSLSSPEFDLKAQADSFSYDYAAFDTIRVEAQYERERLDLIDVSLRGKEAVYSMKGYVPIDFSMRPPQLLERELELEIDLRGIEPWMFQPATPYSEAKEGTMQGKIHAGGTPGKPRISGALVLEVGQFYVKAAKMLLSDLRAYLRFADDRIEVDSVSARVDEGAVEASGVIHLVNMRPDNLDIDIELVKFPVRGLEDIYAVIDADLRIEGDPKEPSVDGKIGIDRLIITTPFQSNTKSRLEPKRLPFTCNLSVDAERSIWIKNQNANIQLDGQLNVKVREGRLFLSGELNTVRGSVSYYDREFEIVSGRLKFTDIPEINPELDILAEIEITYTSQEGDMRRSIQDVIRLQITGTMRSPQVNMSSESGQLGKLDIISLLVLNMTWGELKAGEKTSILRIQTAGRALDLAAAHFARKIQAAVRLDALRLKVRPFGRETGARLTAGKYISRRLYASYTKELLSTANDEYRLEYFMGRRTSIVGERNEAGRYYMGMNYRFRFRL